MMTGASKDKNDILRVNFVLFISLILTNHHVIYFYQNYIEGPTKMFISYKFG